MGSGGAGWCSGCRGWCSGCRGDLGDRGAGGGLVGDGVPGRAGRDERGDAEVVDGAGKAPAGVVDEGDRVVGEQGVAAAAGQGEVVADVAGGLLAGHAVEVGAQAGALIEGGQDAEGEPGAQGGLADEQGGEAGRGVEVVAGEHADRLELRRAELVSLLQDQDGGAAALGGFGGEGADRKSTRLNSSHMSISYAVFCLKKKKKMYILVSHKKKKKKVINQQR